MKKQLFLLPYLPLFTAVLLLASTASWSLPVLTPGDLDQYAQICAGSASDMSLNNSGTKLLLFGPDDKVPGLHDQLPDLVHAAKSSEVGALVCISEQVSELEVCNFGLFFAIPRLRTDYIISAISLQTGMAGAIMELNGTEPTPCDDVGVIDSTVTSIAGAPPDITALWQALEGMGLTDADDDNDGLSNLVEFIRNSDSLDAGSPGASVSVVVNNSTDLTLPEGEAFTIRVSMTAGAYKKAPTDYYVYMDALGAQYSYIYPKKLQEVDEPEVSVRHVAINFTNLKLITLPGFGTGDYDIQFNAEVENLGTLSSSAHLKIVPNTWQFTDITLDAGFDYSHGYLTETEDYENRDLQISSAGVAAGDYDNDGWVDLYITRGTIGENLLFRNLGDGSFEETGTTAGVNLASDNTTGAVFADYDGDGYLDLFVGRTTSDTTNPLKPTLFHNDGNGAFTDVTDSTGLTEMLISFGGAYADIDRDGDLDLWVNHWLWNRWQAYLWQNNGDGTFTDISEAAGIPVEVAADNATNFADINNDGWPDILISGDYGTSQVLMNDGDGTFTVVTTAVISDENGMGGAVADYDNDGDLDWFVSSVYDLLGQQDGVFWGATGNRLYQNQGDGSFLDVTEESGTRIGYWGWGSCFADFNNDSHLDLFHVNGWSAAGFNQALQFDIDPSVLFISDQNGAFMERSSELGIQDNDQGRGIVCFDFDRDGDIDIFIANSEQPPRLFRNDGGNLNNYLSIRLEGEQLNTQAIGARVYVNTGNLTQMREVQISNNYMSQNPVDAFFGLGKTNTVDSIHVVWPSGAEVFLEDITPNQELFIALP